MRGSTGVTVTGKGAVSNPYLISIDAGKVAVYDTPTVDMHLTGRGTSADFYHLSATATVALDDLTDVNAPAPAAGQILSWNATSQRWVPTPPVTATPGAVHSSDGLSGDGSTTTPLLARPNLAAGIQVDSNGIGIQSGVLASVNRVSAGWRSYTPQSYSVDSGNAVASTGQFGRYSLLNGLCTAYGNLTLGADIANVAVTLPVAATSRILNLGTLMVYGTGAPADQSGIARVLSGTVLNQVVVHALSAGFRGGSKGCQITWNVNYETAVA